MRSLLISTTAFFLLCLSGADPPDCAPSSASLLIEGPEEAAPGELVKLKAGFAGERAGKNPQKTQAQSNARFLWELARPVEGFQINEWTFDEGRTCVFATGQPGTYRFILAGARLKEDGTPDLFLTRHVLTIRDETPNPGPEPGPEPDPQPGPDLPDGRFGLAPFVYKQVQEGMPVSEHSMANSLSENYRSIAAKIAAGALSRPEQILSETTEGNREIVGDRREAWEGFFQKLSVRMQELNRSGDLKTAEDFQQAWTEIADGLEAVP